MLFAGGGFSFFFLTWARARMLGAEDERLARSTGQPFVSRSGEAFVGRVHLKSPFAHLTATSTELRFVFGWKRYTLSRTSIERLGRWNPLWGGLVIRHSIAGYPTRMVFVPRDIAQLETALESLGYQIEAGYVSDS